MKFIHNISIRRRLSCIFLIWVLLFVGYGMFALRQMHYLKGVTTDIYEESLKILDVQSELHNDIIKMQNKMRNLILLEDELKFYQEVERINNLEEKIYNNLNIIKEKTMEQEEILLKQKITKSFEQWKDGRDEVLRLIMNQQYDGATILVLDKNNRYVNELEESLLELNVYEYNKANRLIVEADKIETNQMIMSIFLLILLPLIGIAVFLIGTRSILRPILKLKETMDKSTHTDEMQEVDITGNNEIADMANHYNLLIKKLKEQFWIKDGQNQLSTELQGDISLEELTQRSINYLARAMEAGKGVLYIYDDANEMLRLLGTYAFADVDGLSEYYALGEGIIGQVALEKKPILLKNIPCKDSYITTGTTKEAPLNIYAFPLIYEDKVYGVVELAAFRDFTEIKQKFIQEMAPRVAINLYTAIQNKKIKDLLMLSEEAKKKAEEAADKLQKANKEMTEQQKLLHKQSSELQETNAQLEEQQSMMEEQSQELQESYAQLEEKQSQLEEQAALLNIQNNELEESNRYKTEFLANISHELRTPLNSIILLSKLITKNNKAKLSEEDLEKVDIIYSAGKELLRLIDDILDLSKIESGKLDINNSEFSTGELLQELHRMFRDMAQEKNIEFAIKDFVKGNLLGDKDKISQILRNFLSNAFKFTEKGSIILKLESCSQQDVVFSVMDTGIGISKEQQYMIFEEFKQLDGSTSRKYGGTGLGLTIAKKLADIMEGEIKVESQEGVGSKFHLYLQDVLIVEDYIKTLSYTEASSAIDNSLNFEKGKTILVIEDDMNFANLIKAINEDLGLNTLIADTGQAGLRLAAEEKVDGILLDLGLPDMEGLEVLKKLKRTIELRTIPVHILSAWDKDCELQKNGAIGYKKKPVNEKEIKDLVSKVLSFSKKEPKKLLIVESKKGIQSFIKDEIQRYNINITIANTEYQGITELNKGVYDAIILDWSLSRGNPLNLCHYMNKHRIEIPVIIYAEDSLSPQEKKLLNQYSKNIIIKTTDSTEALLDQATLFLHKIKNDTIDNFYSSGEIEDAGILEGKKILIVDDDVRNIFVLATALENHGAIIYDAENGEIALERLNKITPDLILMDIMMPVMDGYATIKAIREIKVLKDVPIIALTAKALKEDKIKCIESGASDYISKPVEYHTLIRVVKAWITK